MKLGDAPIHQCLCREHCMKDKPSQTFSQIRKRCKTLTPMLHQSQQPQPIRLNSLQPTYARIALHPIETSWRQLHPLTRLSCTPRRLPLVSKGYKPLPPRLVNWWCWNPYQIRPWMFYRLSEHRLGGGERRMSQNRERRSLKGEIEKGRTIRC